MKIVDGDKVYIQNFDAHFLLKEVDVIPPSVADELYANDVSFRRNGTDQYRFDVGFAEPSSIKWLLEQDYILDFAAYYDLSLGDLANIERALSGSIYEAKNTSFASGTGITEKSIIKQRNIWIWHKFMSVTAMIEYKEGDVEFVFPNSPAQKRGVFARLLGKISAR